MGQRDHQGSFKFHFISTSYVFGTPPVLTNFGILWRFRFFLKYRIGVRIDQHDNHRSFKFNFIYASHVFEIFPVLNNNWILRRSYFYFVHVSCRIGAYLGHCDHHQSCKFFSFLL